MVSVRSTVHCTQPTVHFFSTHCAFNLVCFIFCVPTVYCTVHPVHCSIIFFLFCVRTTVRTVFKAFPLFIFLFIYFFVNVCCFLLHSVFNIFLVYGTYRTVYCAYGLFYFQFIVQLFYCFFCCCTYVRSTLHITFFCKSLFNFFLAYARCKTVQTVWYVFLAFIVQFFFSF